MLEGADRCYADGDKPQQCILTGTWDLQVEQPLEVQSLINGQKSWALIGTATQSTALGDFPNYAALYESRISKPMGNLAEISWRSSESWIGELEISARQPASGPVRPPGDPTECEEQCSKKGPFCLIATLNDTHGLIQKVDRTRTLLSNHVDLIKKTDFMQIFGQGTDECKRSDTTISSEVLTNSGEGCWLTSSISEKQSASFRIYLPNSVTATRSFESQALVFTFPTGSEAPDVQIGNLQLDAQFGGRVLRVSAGDKGGVISTGRGCIAINLK